MKKPFATKTAIETHEHKPSRRIVLKATDVEKRSTSLSMYKDAKMRVSYHNAYLSDSIVIDKHVAFFQQHAVGKRVLFVGGSKGLGILPFLCAKSGAAHVAVTDESEAMDYCEEIARENPSIASRMQLFRGSVDALIKTALNGAAHVVESQKFDFVFIDWPTSVLTSDRAAIRDLVTVRETLLCESGSILPDTATLYATGLNDYDYFNSSINWWSNVYGFKMNSMKPAIEREPVAGSVPENTIVTPGVKAMTMRSMDITQESASYNCAFSLKGRYARTSIIYVTLYTHLTFHPTNGRGFQMASHASDSYGYVQPVSLYLPEFVPLCDAEELRLQMAVQSEEGVKGTRITLKGSYPDRYATRTFVTHYLHQDTD